MLAYQCTPRHSLRERLGGLDREEGGSPAARDDPALPSLLLAPRGLGYRVITRRSANAPNRRKAGGRVPRRDRLSAVTPRGYAPQDADSAAPNRRGAAAGAPLRLHSRLGSPRLDPGRPRPRKAAVGDPRAPQIEGLRPRKADPFAAPTIAGPIAGPLRGAGITFRLPGIAGQVETSRECGQLRRDNQRRSSGPGD